MTESKDLTSLPPIHPGRMMTELLMRQRGTDLETVARKSGISVAVLKDFATGDAQMTLPMRNKLRGVFGEAANSLYRMQLTYNYFREHGRRPPQRSLR